MIFPIALIILIVGIINILMFYWNKQTIKSMQSAIGYYKKTIKSLQSTIDSSDKIIIAQKSTIESYDKIIIALKKIYMTESSDKLIRSTQNKLDKTKCTKKVLKKKS